MSKLRINDLESLDTGASVGVDALAGVPSELSALSSALDSRVIYVDTIADLLLLPTSELVNNQQVQVKEYSSGIAVGGGRFYWSAASTEADNGGTVLAVSGVATGRWKRPETSSIQASWFGAAGDGVADDTSAIQSAIDIADGRPVILNEGTFLISSTLYYEPPVIENGGETAYRNGFVFRGAGAAKTVLDSRVANGPCIRVAGESSPTGVNLSMFSELEHFSITCLAGTKPATSHGILYNGARFVRTSHVYIHDITGDGFRCEQSDGIENDQVAFVQFFSCLVRDVSRFGFYSISNAEPPGNATAHVLFDGCQFARCAFGGAFLNNVQGFTFKKGAIVTCGASGKFGAIYTTSNGKFPHNIVLEENELGNGCEPYAVSADGFIQFHSIRNRYVGVPGEAAPTNGIILNNSTGETSEFYSTNDYIAYLDTITPFTMYKTNGAVKKLRIENPFYWVFDESGGQVKYDFASGTSEVSIVESGNIRADYGSEVASEVVSDGTITPDLYKGYIHRIAVDTTQSLAIADPTPGALIGEGKRLVIRILNGSGAQFTPTFGPIYLTKSIPIISNGSWATVEFFYDHVSGKYVQIGAWS